MGHFVGTGHCVSIKHFVSIRHFVSVEYFVSVGKFNLKFVSVGNFVCKCGALCKHKVLSLCTYKPWAWC